MDTIKSLLPFFVVNLVAGFIIWTLWQLTGIMPISLLTAFLLWSIWFISLFIPMYFAQIAAIAASKFIEIQNITKDKTK